MNHSSGDHVRGPYSCTRSHESIMHIEASIVAFQVYTLHKGFNTSFLFMFEWKDVRGGKKSKRGNKVKRRGRDRR